MSQSKSHTISTNAASSITAVSAGGANHKEGRINVPKIVTASLSGLAGGATVAAMVTPIIASLFIGSLLGASVTGFAEYLREKKAIPSRTENLG